MQQHMIRKKGYNFIRLDIIPYTNAKENEKKNDRIFTPFKRQRPILDLQALEQDGHVNVVSVTGWLAESFRRCRFSAAAVFFSSSKLSAVVFIVPLHSSLSSASASHSLWSMQACVSCRFNWSLKRLRGGTTVVLALT